MVKLTSILFLTTLLVSAFATPHVKRGDITGDLEATSNAVATLEGRVQYFKENPKNVSAAMAIHNQAQNLCGSLQIATADAQANKPYTDAEATQIFNQIASLKPNVFSTLQLLQDLKPEFEALPIAGATKLVHSDLVQLLKCLSDCFDAIIRNFPPDQVAKANAMKEAFVNAFNTAIATYNN